MSENERVEYLLNYVNVLAILSGSIGFNEDLAIRAINELDKLLIGDYKNK